MTSVLIIAATLFPPSVPSPEARAKQAELDLANPYYAKAHERLAKRDYRNAIRFLDQARSVAPSFGFHPWYAEAYSA